MATIVTVHGTFSSGPLEGEKWWQLGSGFASGIPQLIEGADRRLVVEPFVWDGYNSETARYAAGARLAARLQALDASGEPFVVIGHSHGGSVLSAALLNAARSKQPLANMRRWITVGTPFLKTQRQRFLFSRLGILGKAIYLTLLTFLLLGVLIALGGSVEAEPVAWVMLMATFLVPIGLFYGLLGFQERRRSLRFNRRGLGFAEQHFADRWLSLWHAKDEAVKCLKAVKRVDVKIFPRHFAASALNLLVIGFIPLLCVLTLNSQSAMNAIAARVFAVIDPSEAQNLYPSDGANIFENAAVLFIGLLVIPANLLLPAVSFDKMPLLAEIGLLVFGLALLLATAALITVAFSVIAKFTSHGLSLVLNPLTLAQLKAATYGSDALEDFAVDAREWPTWLTRGYPPLPPRIADGIEAASDAAIGTAVPKFRNIVDSLTAAESAEATSDVVADYLTWRELIYTSYFDDEDFLALLAYALCHTGAFHPTPLFAGHPAFAIAGEAYASITQSAVVASPAPLQQAAAH